MLLLLLLLLLMLRTGCLNRHMTLAVGSSPTTVQGLLSCLGPAAVLAMVP
jgi:hypothetical protein